MTKTLRELRSCYNNHHTQNYIMENEIPKCNQEKNLRFRTQSSVRKPFIF